MEDVAHVVVATKAASAYVNKVEIVVEVVNSLRVESGYVVNPYLSSHKTLQLKSRNVGDFVVLIVVQLGEPSDERHQ